MRYLLCIFIILNALQIKAQEKYTISGSVKDSITGEILIGAYVYVPQQKVGCTTNAYGFYSLTLSAGNYRIRYEYLGYISKDIDIQLTSTIVKNIEIKSKSVSLNELVVSAEASNENVTSTSMSVQKLDMKQIKSLPVLFGETDVLKIIQRLPGIKSAGE